MELMNLLNSDIPNHFPVVVDIHHHWINSGNYIEADDNRWLSVKQSWRNTTPKNSCEHHT